MRYERPMVHDLGSITGYTRTTPGPNNNIKGGFGVAHLDKKCEWSGGSDTDFCSGPTATRPGQPASK